MASSHQSYTARSECRTLSMGFAAPPKTSKPFSAVLKAFCEVLSVLTSMQDKLSRNNALCDWLDTHLENRLNVFEEFKVTLNTHTEVRREGTREVREWKGIAWAFRVQEVQLFRDMSSTNKHSSSVSIGANDILIISA